MEEREERRGGERRGRRGGRGGRIRIAASKLSVHTICVQWRQIHQLSA